jgi:hypothetical protein
VADSVAFTSFSSVLLLEELVSFDLGDADDKFDVPAALADFEDLFPIQNP